MNVETRLGNIETRHGRFVGGAADRVEVIEVDTGTLRVMILPTRGMSIWRMEKGRDGILMEFADFRARAPITGPRV